ncbi:uncharacterized protein VTP21DRAFT_10534 [Calcarisporiella thermophila]|uniref:uncharacterized protein n=1 Tax=Calcarisporiella thermophila TaxID=911321 RepID=UPI0037444B4B
MKTIPTYFNILIHPQKSSFSSLPNCEGYTMAFWQFIGKNKALAPLFVIVGAGISGGIGFMGYYLNHPDVILNKRSNPRPWNAVKDHENTKLLTINKSFFEARKGLPVDVEKQS